MVLFAHFIKKIKDAAHKDGDVDVIRKRGLSFRLTETCLWQHKCMMLRYLMMSHQCAALTGVQYFAHSCNIC